MMQNEACFMLLANKEASEVPLVVNLVVIVPLGSSELKCHHYELWAYKDILEVAGSVSLRKRVVTQMCALPKKESNVAVTGYCK